MTWLETIAGGAVGGGIVALFGLSKTGQIVQLTVPGQEAVIVTPPKRPPRQLKGFPSTHIGYFSNGVAWHYVRPTIGRDWHIVSVYWEIETDATVTTREPIVRFPTNDAPAQVYQEWRLPPLTASKHYRYLLGPGHPYGTYQLADADHLVYILPMPLESLLRNEYLIFLMLSGQAGDAHRVSIVYEESEA